MSRAHPIMDWNSQEPVDAEGRVVWWSRLDHRYHVEVQRNSERTAMLYIFDHDAANALLYATPVELSYGARLGADVLDIDSWQHVVMAFIDTHAQE